MKFWDSQSPNNRHIAIVASAVLFTSVVAVGFYLFRTPAKKTPANIVYERLEKNQGSYNLTMLLLAAAISQDNTNYDRYLSKLLDQISCGLSYQSNATAIAELIDTEQEETPSPEWYLGRAVSAATFIGNDRNARTLAEKLLHHLQTHYNKHYNQYTLWAWGYLLSYYACYGKEQYEKYKAQISKYIGNLHAADMNLSSSSEAWAKVMFLYAAGQAEDRTTYDEIVKSMKLSEGTSLLEALQIHIPVDDYQEWAIAHVAIAAAKVDDRNNHEELAHAFKKADLHEEGIGTNQTISRALAKLYMDASLQAAPDHVAVP